MRAGEIKKQTLREARASSIKRVAILGGIGDTRCSNCKDDSVYNLAQEENHSRRELIAHGVSTQIKLAARSRELVACRMP